LNNLKRSWLSREILFELIFMALAASLALLVLKKAYRPTLVRILVGLAFTASTLFLMSMAKLYMMRTVPAWRGLFTPLSFLGTTLLLGSLATAFSYDTLLDLGRKARPFLDAAAIVGLASVVLIILTLFLFSPGLGLFGPKKATLLELPLARQYPYILFRLIFLSGAVVCAFLYYRNPGSPLLALAFLSALAAEATGRWLFYLVYSRLGV